jgi:hypothetical protein
MASAACSELWGSSKTCQAVYDDPETAFGPDGVAAGNDALSVIFGSPEVSRAVTDQAQNVSEVGSDVLKKMLPVLAGVVLSGLMRSGSSGKAASPGRPAPSGGSLGDILGQIFGRGMPGSPSAPADAGQKFPPPARQPRPPPTDAGAQPTPEGDILGSIVRELEKGIREGRIKPVIICRVDRRVRCRPAPRHHRYRAATSLAKSYAMSLAERWAAPPKCPKGDKDSRRR